MIVDTYHYNLIRTALGEKNTDPNDIDIISFPAPYLKNLAVRKTHEPDVLKAARQILDDPKSMQKITPMDTIYSLIPYGQPIPPELALYVLSCYAVAIQQGWIIYSQILSGYRVNPENIYAAEYTQDIHHKKL